MPTPTRPYGRPAEVRGRPIGVDLDPRRVDALHSSTPEAFLWGTKRRLKPYTGAKRNLTLGEDALLELHRQHTHAHLYDEVTLLSREQLMYLVRQEPERFDRFMVEQIHNARERMMLDLPDDIEDWDCDTCRRSVITREGGVCPGCGER